MTSKYLIFTALLSVPLSAVICHRIFLYFFILFPLSAVVTANWRYCRALLLLSLPPVVFLVWSYFSGNGESLQRSLRWICALASGSYFASELGTAGVALVLRSMRPFPLTGKLSELMLLAGSVTGNAKQCWKENVELPLLQRIIQSAEDSVSKAEPVVPEQTSTAAVPLFIAMLSWLFLLVSISGIADGVAG
ncbi:MAG: hypothetical protein KAH54_10400 [Candidatus Sabulitectum sp.]|nr:hypothetical protein [Candidatus Sabulitectum sp.]